MLRITSIECKIVRIAEILRRDGIAAEMIFISDEDPNDATIFTRDGGLMTARIDEGKDEILFTRLV